MKARRIVIVGASLAGFRTAQELRSHGYEGELELVGEEAIEPYDRPPLSKQILTGQRSPADIRLAPSEEYSTSEIGLRLGVRATRVDPQRRVVETASGETLPYDDLVVATGVRARHLPGVGTPGVHTLRTLADATQVAETLRRCSHLVIVGGGFIGAEVASVARGLGREVTMVEAEETPLARAVGNQMGTAITDLHRERGVTVRVGTPLDRVLGSARAEGVKLVDGSEIAADGVLVGVGTVPNTEWLNNSGFDVVNGIACDSAGRVLGVSNVYAVGDVASWHNDVSGLSRRVEHWTNAVEQARVVASRILVGDTHFASAPVVPYFWSDQYRIKIQFVGEKTADVQVVHGAVSEQRFFAVYRNAEGVVVGALAFNEPRLIGMSKRWIGQRLTSTDVEQSLSVLA